MKIESRIINNFIENLPPKCKSPLDTIITKMLESSKYIDDSTIIFDVIISLRNMYPKIIPNIGMI